MPTHRFALLLLPTALLIALAAWLPLFIWIALAYFLLALGIALYDWRMGGSAEMFTLTRSHDNRLSLGADNTVTLTVNNKQQRPVHFDLRDEPPDAWVNQPTILHGSVPPRQTWQDSYSVHPLRRGDYQFGNLSLRWLTPLALWQRQATLAKTAPVRVYPNLLDIRKYDLFLRRNRLQQVGLRNSRQFGEGTEYDRLRDYLPDDDFRRINWKATARRRKPITVEYQIERSQNILVALDVGRMMQTPVGNIAKLDYVINAALLLSYVATGMGDRMGMLTFADDVQQFVPPKQGRKQFYRMLELLYAIKAQPVEPDFNKSISYLRRRQRKRSLIVLFTDLSSGVNIDTLVTNISQLARRSLPLVVTISDPDIVAASHLHPSDTLGVYQRAAATQLLEERRIALDSLARRGVLTLDVPANQLSLSVIQRYLEIKRKSLL